MLHTRQPFRAAWPGTAFAGFVWLHNLSAVITFERGLSSVLQAYLQYVTIAVLLRHVMFHFTTYLNPLLSACPMFWLVLL